MRRILTLITCCCFAFSILHAQQIGTPGYLANLPQNPNARSGPPVTPQNGNNALGNIYSNTACGLNYAQATNRLGQRFQPVGVAQPAPLVISGVPACAVIDKAYLWTEVLGPNAVPVTASLVNPLGATTNYPMTNVGSSVDVCWGMSGTHVYRADVTSCITGNGTYSISGLPTSISNSAHDVEGATLMIIYRDLSASYTGSIRIDDGAHTVTGGSLSHTMSGINACANSSAGSAFMLVGDMQMSGYTITMNGSGNVPVNWDWWNFISTPTSVTNGQSTCSYSLNHSGDCFTLAVAGLYYQTSCMNCTPLTPVLTLSAGITPDSCSGNGSATITVSGGTPPYTYAWATNPPQSGPTATNLTAGTYQVQVTDSLGNCGGMTVVIPYSGPVLSLSSTPTGCTPSGTATASVSGGSAPYTYLWNSTPPQSTPTATQLGAGTYSVTVTDANSCVIGGTVQITQPPTLQLGTASSPASYCLSNSASDGEAVVYVISGGTPPYTYAWNTVPVQTNDTAFNLGAGTYSVTVTDANGCTGTAVATVGQTPAISVSTSVTPAPCNGTGSASVTNVSGGSPPYTYSWNSSPPQTTPTATNLPPGNYTVTVTDTSGCAHITPIVIITQSGFNFTTSSTPATFCSSNSANDGSATVFVTGGTPPYSYAWSTNPVQTTTTASNLYTGSYYVLVTDSVGCTDSVTVYVGSSPTITLATSSTPAPCNGTGTATVSASGGAPPYTYAWNTTPVQITPTATGLQPGNYLVNVTDTAGCMVTALVTVNSASALSVSISSTSAPCNGVGSATANVTNGTPPYTYSWNTNPVQTTQTANGLVPGTYAVTVTDSAGCSVTDSVAVTSSGFVFVYAYQVPTPCNAPLAATAFVFGGTPPYTFAWNTNPVQTGDTATGLAPGNYLVQVTDVNGCQSTATVTIVPGPFQAGAFGPSWTDCSTGTILSGWSSDTTAVFTWQPGNLSGNNIFVNPFATITYTMSATTSCGTVTDTFTVYVDTVNYYAEDICAVTVDTSVNKYMIIWQRLMPISSGTYNIYKETPPNSNTYVLIASQPVAQFSTYTDPASNPSSAPDRYKLTTTDTCGYESMISPHHRPIFLTVAPGQTSGWDLSWTTYEGFTPWGHDIYRGTSLNNMSLLTSVSGSTFTYSDLNPPTGTLFYMIEASNTILCSPSRTAQFALIDDRHASSNIASTNLQSIAGHTSPDGSLVLAPNPGSGEFSLSFTAAGTQKLQVQVFDALGQLVHAQEQQNATGHYATRLGLHHLAEGVYMLQLSTERGKVMRKLVISR